MKHRDRRILNRCFISKHFDSNVSFQNVPDVAEKRSHFHSWTFTCISMEIAATVKLFVWFFQKDASAVAFTGPALNPEKIAMYIGVTFDRNSPYRHQIPAVSTRSLEANRIFQYLYSNATAGMRIFFNPKSRESYIVKYVYGFSKWKFSYFLTIQQKYSSFNAPNEYITKLVRICQKETSYNSYTEIPIDCTKDGVKYNLVQAAYLSKPATVLAETDKVLYAVFSQGNDDTALNRSAFCMYSLASIEEKFIQNIQNCYDGNGFTGLDFISSSKPCIKDQILSRFCSSFQNFPLGGEQAIVAAAMAIFQEQLTSIVVTNINKNTFAFVGTNDGCLKKIRIEFGTSIIEIVDIKVFESIPINSLHFDLSKRNLYARTKNRVAKINVDNDCTAFSNCDNCVGAKHPYCGWCPYENRCTLESDCLDEYYSSISWKNQVSSKIDYMNTN